MRRWQAVVAVLAVVTGLLGLGTQQRPAAAAPLSGVAVDPAFSAPGGLAGSIEAVVVQRDGKVLIGGSFEAVAGVPRASLARLNADGSLDQTFAPGAGPMLADGGTQRPGAVSSLALQTDGKILVGGWFDSFGGVPRATVVRLLANGAVDPSFDPGAGARDEQALGGVEVIAVAPDGRVLVGGHFGTFNGVNRRDIVRLTPAGAVDPSFAPGSGFADGRVSTMAVTTSGAVVVGGDFTEYNGVSRAGLVRVLPTGAVDPTFNPGSGPVVDMFGSIQPGQVASLAVREDGKIVIGGWFSAFNGTPRSSLAQLNANGSIDAAFGGGDGFEAEGFQPWVHAVALQPDGKVVVGGDFDAWVGVPRPWLARLTTNGTLDLSFAAGGGALSTGAAVSRLALQGDGRLLVVGDFETYGGAVRAGLARVTATGALDVGFAPLATRGRGFNGEVTAVVVQPDGKLLVGGAFSTYNGVPRRGIARLNSNGTLDPTFNASGGTTSVLDGSPAVTALARQPDGKVLVGGWFTEFDGIARNGVLRLNADGTLDAGFDPGTGVAGLWEGHGTVNSIAVQADGKVIIGGWFTSVDEVARNGISRLNADGTVDASFNPGSGFLGPEYVAPVLEVVLAADGKVIVGGAFERANGVSRRGIARLNADGSLDGGFNPGSGAVADQWGSAGTVNALNLLPDGKILVGGDFGAFDGAARGSIARLHPNGSLDAGFAAGSGFANSAYSAVVWSVVVQPDGALLVGGEFDSYDGVSRRGLARLSGSGALDTYFTADLGLYQPVKAMAVQTDGRIVLGGRFAGFAGTFPTPVNIVRLMPQIAPPGAPTGLAVTAGDRAALVAFTPPTDHGGAPVTTYQYSLNGGAWQSRSPASASSPLLINGLTNGSTYRVRVRAVNSAGPGTASAESTVVPSAPVASTFVPVAPARVVDTRRTQGGAGPIDAGSTRVFGVGTAQVGGQTVVPPGAVAVAYNLTVPTPTAGGHLRLMPADAAVLTSASAVNFRPGETIANAAVVKVDSQRQIKVYAGASADLIIDIVGYFVPASTGATAGRFTAVTPVRVYDGNVDAAGLLAPGASRVVSVATTQDGRTMVVPAGASAVAYTITVVRPEGSGHLRVMPGDVASSPSSTINWTAKGDVIANGSTVQVDSLRRMKVHNGATVPVRFLVDVVGYYSATGANFYPTDPARVSDSRTGQGGAGPVQTSEAGVRVVPVAAAQVGGMTIVPPAATAIAYNLTVTGTGTGGHLRAYPARAPLVTASVLNWPGAGYTRANGTVVAVSAEREITIYNGSTSTVDAVVDVLGYYR